MYFIAGIVVGSVIGFMLAWFLFNWLASMSEEETEHYSQSSRQKTETSVRPKTETSLLPVFMSITCTDRHPQGGRSISARMIGAGS